MALIKDPWGLNTITIPIVLIIIAYLYMTRNFKYWKKRGVLEVTPTAFVGNFMDCLLLKKSPSCFLKELYERAKDELCIGFYIFDKPFLLLCDRELIKNALIRDFNIFSDRYMMPDPSDRLGYATLFFIRNPAWKIVRTKLTPFFTSGKLKKMFGLILECGKHLSDYIDSLKLDDKGQIIEVNDISSKLTMDVVCSAAYGLEVNTFKDPKSDFLRFGKMIFSNSYTRALEILALFFLPGITRMLGLKVFGKGATIFLRKLFWETINRRMESGEKRYDLIDILVELRKNHSDDKIEDFKFDGDDLLAQASSFFSAGFQPTAVPISFTLGELALQPEIQSTLRTEILEALDNSDGHVTYDMVMSLPYLDMVVSETLRKYPPLGFLNRMTTQTYKVPNSNIVLEKGTPIYIPILALHHDPEYFPEPDKFDPERFNEENKRNIPACVYFPFGEGPRTCIGTRFGLLTIKVALIEILSKCEVLPCEKTLIPIKIDPVLTMTSPLNGVVYLKMRKINTD